VFVDASKDPARVRMLRKYGHIEPYVIHLLRDSPAFVNSFIKNDRQKLATAIRWWNRTIWQLERLKATLPPNRWLLVRYEDLCANPEVEIQRVLRFLGVPTERPNLDFRHSSHHIIGNKMRLGDDSKIQLDTSWRDELSKNQVIEIEARTARYRKAFGYATT
jgi:Sulfotransferase family